MAAARHKQGYNFQRLDSRINASDWYGPNCWIRRRTDASAVIFLRCWRAITGIAWP
jgi:hypothetical protein